MAGSISDNGAAGALLGGVLCDSSLSGILAGIDTDGWGDPALERLAGHMLKLSADGAWDERALLVSMRADKRFGSSDRVRLLSRVALQACLPSSVPGMARRLQVLSRRRKQLRAGEKICALARDETEEDFLGLGVEALAAVPADDESVDVADGVKSYMDHVLAVQEGKVEPVRIRTKLAVDDLLGGGMQLGWMVVVLGVSGHGKTGFAMCNVALETAMAGRPALIESLEMPRPQVVGRLLGALAGIPSIVHDQPGLSQGDIGKLLSAADTLSALPITIADDRTAGGIYRRARALGVDGGVVVVDYLQLLAGGKSDSSREEVLSSASRTLKRMALELNCVVVVVAQPNLAAKRSGKRPTAADLKGAGSVDDDCDLMIVPWIPHRVDETANRKDAELAIANSRHTATGVVRKDQVMWSPSRVCFRPRRLR